MRCSGRGQRKRWGLAAERSVLRTRGDDTRVSADVSDEERSAASLRPVPAVVFAAGFLMALYGVFFVLADGEVLRSR